jgi:hypothetical protein
MAMVFTLLLALVVLEPLVLAPALVEVLLLLEPQAATMSDRSATPASRPIPRSARFVRACMESSSPFVLAESKLDRVTLPEGPGRPPGGRRRAAPYLVGC